jgi:hypothetical protein
MRSSNLLVAHGCAALTCLLVAGCLGGWDDYRVGAGTSTGVGGDAPTGGTGAAGGGGGDAAPERCGGTAMLADDFTMIDSTKAVWRMDGATSIDAGELLIRPAANSMEYSWNALSSEHFYDLRGDAVSIEIKSMVNTASGAHVSLVAYDDNDNAVVFSQQGGTLSCSKWIDGMQAELGRAPYDPIAHRFWRMREASGTLAWETSADGLGWTTQASSSNLFDLGSVKVQLVAEVNAGEPDPGEARFDNLNGGKPRGAWCKSSTLKDDFDDGVTSFKWHRSYFDGACQHVENGELVFSVPPDMRGFCYYTSSSAFDLTADTLTVKVPVTPDPATSTNVLFAAYISGDINRKLEFGLSKGQLFFREYADQSTKVFGDLPFDPSQHLFWRLRESAGKVFWETSADGQTWKVGAETPASFPVTALDVTLGFENDEMRPDPIEVHFDNLNIP